MTGLLARQQALWEATMRVLLINPHYPISETPSPPLGLAFLAAALETRGVQVRILDLVVYPYHPSQLEALLDQFRPHMVGVTAVSMNVDHALSLVKDIKKSDPAIITVMGGPHVSFCAVETLRVHPELDLVVKGEGEATLVELSHKLTRRDQWGTIKGLVYREGQRIIDTGVRPVLEDMEALPMPARHLLPLGRYRALGMPVSMTTSRGCPFKCIFCVGRKMVGSRVRLRAPSSVVDELEYLNSLNFNQINLADDLFTANSQHCLAVCDEILRRGLDVAWTSFARVDTVSHALLTRMRSAGCHTVSFGVESGNAAMLRRIKKGITLDQVVRAVKMCLRADIAPHASFILGLPGETPETLEETLAFGERLKAMGVFHGFHVLAPFPGTQIREKARQYDLRILSHDWSDYHANRAIVETSGVKRAMLDAVLLRFERKFDDWLGRMGRRYRQGEITAKEAWPLLRLEHTVRIYDLMMQTVVEQDKAPCEEGLVLSPTEKITALAQRASQLTDHSAEALHQTLHFAVDQGYLKYDQGKACWHWVDYL